MALTLWKSFDFFSKSQLEFPADDVDPAELSSFWPGTQLFVGHQDGRVSALSPKLKVDCSWQAHESGRVTHIHQAGHPLLVTVAEDLTHEPELKVWALDQIDKKSNRPKCLSTTLVHNGRKQFPISALATLNNLTQVAVGFGNGAVTIVRGDLINDRGAKQRTVFESEEPITAIEFRDGANPALYIATTGRVLTLALSGKAQLSKTLDDVGCGIGCMALDEATGDVVVVRDDTLQYYSLRGRGPSVAFEGHKQLVLFFHDRLVVLSQQNRQTSLTVLDTDLKFLAHQESLPYAVRTAFVAWDEIYVLVEDGRLYKYTEKSLQQKLDLLYQRDLYILAINLAQKYGANSKQRSAILRRYGDHLHRKGDFDTAMQQYLKAIDSIEPSQVIRKFLDSRRMHNLIEYLEELHEHGMATVDHTSLLLNCYAKLKNTDKLETFIKSDAHFDFDTAVSMCRQGGYFEQAIFLAKKHQEHGLVAEVLIEDAKDYTNAIRYIRRLDAPIAYPILVKYARVLLRNCSDETTNLFCDYFTGRYKPCLEEAVPLPDTTGVPNLASFIPLPYRQTPETPPTEPPDYKIPAPHSVFSSFVDHSEKFIVFLTTLLAETKLSVEDLQDVKTTLFEVYLECAAQNAGPSRQIYQEKARELMDEAEDSIDSSSVLLVSHLTAFDEGTRRIREEQGLLFDIFRSYTSAKDTPGVIASLHKYGPQQPQLYSLALSYFCSSRQILEEVGDEIDAILQKIANDQILSPIQVIQTLSVNDVASVGLVKRYLAASVEQEQKEITSNRRLIESYRLETKTKQEEIGALETQPTVFQTRRCASCSRSLDLPTVHFLCKHSYHKECLNEKEGQAVECPQCAPNNANLRAFRRAQEDMVDRHDLFADALNRSHDKFGTLSEFFGRGVVSML